MDKEFETLEDSFLSPIIKMARREKDMVFSRNLIHQLLLRRIKIDEKGLWFSFGEQPMRFSLREFHLATGLPCVVNGEEEEIKILGTKKKKKDPWMNKNQTVKALLDLLVKDSKKLTADQRLRLGATIFVEGILIANNPVTSIPVENLFRARYFQEYCKYPWRKLAYDALCVEVKKVTTKVLKREQYGIPGFIYAIQLWALSSVDQLDTFFGDEDGETQFPLCLHWVRTKSPTMDEVIKIDSNEKVIVKCILGDTELHSNLIEEVDTQFGSVVDLVQRGYRLKRQDWHNGRVNIAVAEAKVEKKNYGHGIDATDKRRLNSSLSKYQLLKKDSPEEEPVSWEAIVDVPSGFTKWAERWRCGEETNGVTVINRKLHASEGETRSKTIAHDMQSKFDHCSRVFFRSISIMQTQDEEEEQVEADDEVGDGDDDKERKTSKINEEQIQDEKDQQVDDDAEVSDGDKDEATIINKEHTQAEEEQQVEVNTEVEKSVQVQKKKLRKREKAHAQEGEEQQVQADAEVADSDKGSATSKVVEAESQEEEAEEEQVEKPVQVKKEETRKRK
ncbi:hypothetical protein N665_0704s0008 [Sinapis alba]|nr:hypothetical protein N665_0704s0008 [Sinapis alba]